jgi:hypothetical protein
MNENEINDKREYKEFSSKTFSNFKKSEAKKQLLNNLLNGKYEESNYWCCEFICAGHFLDIWEYIIEFIGKNIHVGNLKLPIYIDQQLNKFIEILKKEHLDNEIEMRNNYKIRYIFSEIICVLCQSNIKPKLEKTKIKTDEFSLINIGFRLKADNINFGRSIIKSSDSQELLIPINELCYNISKKIKNSQYAYYWIDWILEYEKLVKKKKEKLKCSRREFIPVESKLQMEPIWIVWETIIKESKNHDKIIQRIIDSLLNIFCVRYSNSTKNKRRYIIYFAITLLTEPLNFDIPIIKDINEINKIKQNINHIYKQIKKNEIQPQTNYLFNNLNSSKNKTVEKLNIMENINFMPRQ